MLNIHPTYKLIDWPYSGYNYVSDLLDFEGPILVHYMNKNKEHALYYWVDGDSDFNRWLCFNVKTLELYRYLKGTLSLLEIVESKKDGIMFMVDIDKDLIYNNTQLVYGYSLPKSYLPPQESRYIRGISPFYDEIFTFIDDDIFTRDNLKQKSLDLALVSNKSTYGGDISLKDSGDFLNCLHWSLHNFEAVEFHKEYINSFTGDDEFVKMSNKILSLSRPIVTDLFHNSFHISIAIDDIVDSGNKYDTFRSKIATRFADEILSVNYNEERDIERILKTYDSFERKRIFGPLIKIINKRDCDLTFIDKSNNKGKRIFEKVNENNRQRILPKNEKENPDSHKVLITITFAADEDKKGIMSFTKRDIIENTLFSSISTAANQSLSQLEFDGFKVLFKQPISITHKVLENDYYEVSFQPLNIKMQNIKTIAYEWFLDEFERIFIDDYLSDNPNNQENKKYLMSIVDTYISYT